MVNFINKTAPAVAWKDAKILALIFVVAILVLSQGLNVHGVGFRDDEVFYFKSTQEMLLSGNYLCPTFLGETRFQKPILFYWLILASYKVFGINWFAARFVGVFFGALTIGMTWLLARQYFNRWTATLSASMLLTVPLFFRNARNAVPDMAMNFFIVLAVYAIVKFFQNPHGKRHSLLFFIACALGFMIKGFAAVIIPCSILVIYSFYLHRPDVLRKINFPAGFLLMASIILPWFLYMIYSYGESYVNYMLTVETKDRLIAHERGNPVVLIITALIHNFFFYMNVLLSYFAPWSALLVGVLPLALRQKMKASPTRESWGLMTIWFFTVLGFFIPLYYKITHYLLILSTPFVILVSAFLLEVLGQASRGQRWLMNFMILVTGISALGMIFLQVFLGSGSGWWILFYFAVFIIYVRLVRNFTRIPLIAPLGLAIIIACIYSVQGQFMLKAGLVSNIVLEKFAQAVHQTCRGDCRVAVASHDIHEKEWQVYFDKKVDRIGTNYDEWTNVLVREFIRQKEPQMYCLITSKNYELYYGAMFHQLGFKIIQEDYMVRKRFSLDAGFFYAILTLNRPRVINYLKEKIILMGKGL